MTLKREEDNSEDKIQKTTIITSEQWREEICQ